MQLQELNDIIRKYTNFFFVPRIELVLKFYTILNIFLNFCEILSLPLT